MYRTALLVAGFLLSLLGMLVSSANAEEKTCGAVLPLSGPMAAVGVSIMNSIILADRQLDHAGRIQFVFEDDQFAPKNTVSAVTKLIQTTQIIDSADLNSQLHSLTNFEGVLGVYGVQGSSFMVPAGLREVTALGFEPIEKG